MNRTPQPRSRNSGTIDAKNVKTIISNGNGGDGGRHGLGYVVESPMIIGTPKFFVPFFVPPQKVVGNLFPGKSDEISARRRRPQRDMPGQSWSFLPDRSLSTAMNSDCTG